VTVFHLKIKSKHKPWITKGIKKYIIKRDSLLIKFINFKNTANKNKFHKLYKTYKTKIVALLNLSKTNFYKEVFNENINSSKATWKGINNISHNSKSNIKKNICLNVNTKCHY